MSVDLLQGIAGLSIAVVRVRLGDDRGDPSLDEISAQFKLLDVAASLTRLQGTFTGFERNHEPVRTLGDIAAGFEASIEWSEATGDLAVAIGRWADPGSKGLADPFIAKVLRSSIRWAISDIVAHQDSARRKTFESLKRIPRDASRKWPRRLLVDVIKEAERAEALTHQALTSFNTAAIEAVGLPWTRRTEVWSAVEEKAHLAATGAHAVAERVPKFEVLAFEDALRTWSDHRSSVLWIRSESPIEIVLTVVGGIAAAAAVLSQLLDLEVKLRTRSLRIHAERKELEEKIEKNTDLIAAYRNVRGSIARGQPPELGLKEVVIHESLDQVGDETY
ncbi:MAG TPA: hypothetical protein VIS95_00335 [Solirubrobacterales bacterium]